MAAKRQLILDLLLRDKTRAGAKSAADNLDDVGDAAADAAKETEKLGKSSDKAEDQVERFGKSARTAAEHVSRLDREIETVERELKQLAVSFAEAETAADRLDLSKAIRRTQSDLRKINTSKGLIKGLLPDPEPAAKNFAMRLVSSIGGRLTSASTALGSAVGPTVGTAIGAAAAPVLISSFSSALSAGSGAGVLGVGIMAVVKGDTTIQAAGKAAGAQFSAGLQDSAKVLRGPVLESLGVLSAAGKRLNKDLGETFDDLSDDLVPLTRKFVGAGEAVTGSLLKAARESGPALDAAGDSVALLGDGVSSFIDTVADGGPEAAANLRLVAGAASDLIAVSGGLLPVLAKLSNEPILTGPLLPLLRDHYAEVADKTKEASGGAQDLAGSQQALATETEKAALAAAHQTDALSDLSKQLKAETDPVFGMLRAQDQLRESQKGVNDAIKEHGRNSPEYQEALRKQAEAALGLEAAAGKVAATSSGKLGPALRTTLREAGFTEAQIRDLERQFRTAKTAGDQFAKNYKASVSVSGTETAQSRIKHVKQLLDGLHSKKISVGVVVADAQLNSLARRLPGAFRAEGGPVRKGKAYVVGEKRPEVFVPDRDGQIIPSLDKFSRGGGSAGASMGGGSAMVLEIRSGGTQFDDLLVEVLSRAVRRRGGNVQQVLGGRNG